MSAILATVIFFIQNGLSCCYTSWEIASTCLFYTYTEQWISYSVTLALQFCLGQLVINMFLGGLGGFSKNISAAYFSYVFFSLYEFCGRFLSFTNALEHY